MHLQKQIGREFLRRFRNRPVRREVGRSGFAQDVFVDEKPSGAGGWIARHDHVGGIGTVRVLGGGRVTEILVGKTDLSYGYTQPVREGQFYNLYHGFVEAKPVTAQTSKLLYTLMYDISDKPDQAAKQADMAQRRTRFEGALKKMKELAEAP